MMAKVIGSLELTMFTYVFVFLWCSILALTLVLITYIIWELLISNNNITNIYNTMYNNSILTRIYQ
jgi:hypothetical protein